MAVIGNGSTHQYSVRIDTMITFLATFILMLLVAAGLAVGLLLRGKELKGSCGGLNNIEGAECGVCGRTTPCENENKA